MEKKSCGLALRAVEFRLKLGGVIQDRRIAHHYNLDQRHPDADQEDLDCDPEEEFDALIGRQPVNAIAPKAPTPKTPALPAPVVTPGSDLSRFQPKLPAAGSLLGSTAMAALMPDRNPTPAPRFRVPHAA